MEDIHEPIEAYRTVFKEAHAGNTSAFFEDLLGKSGVDEQANATTVRELRALEQQVKEAGSSSKWWKILRIVVIVAAALCLVLAFAQSQWLWLIGVAAAGGLVFAKLNPRIRDVDARLTVLEGQRDARLAEAEQQMAALNQLYDWDITAKLVQQTVPRLELDPYFTNGRLDELRQSFGWKDEFNNQQSVLFAHSGVLNGNPFVLAQLLQHWMGSKTYHGSLNITWTEQRRDANGNMQTVSHSQTLQASLDKPFPEYDERALVIYANEAAPDLSFSRTPSDLSGVEGGIVGNWRKGRAIKKLEARSRQIDKGKGFTVMANREFDALFGATDRNHEIQFRLLFTPLAQQEMIKLLKDKETGYGDDFTFTKERMINVVEPAHLGKTDIGADPAKFHQHEVAAARKFFNEYHNDFFRSFFFGMAPLLTIPLYQQHRSHQDIYKDVYGRASCFWEHESIANFFGAKRFEHPQCVTRSILKTEAASEPDGTHVLRVAAHGHGGTDRLEHVSMRGGDGRYHDVPVNWVEYFEVQQDSTMVVREDAQQPDAATSWQTLLQSRGVDPRDAVVRRSIVAALLPR